MNMQEAFNIQARGIIAQGGPSTIGSLGCAYRGLNGRKCGVGHLITDAEYVPGMEGRSVSVLLGIVRSTEGSPSFSKLSAFEDMEGDQVDFAEAIQQAHDHASNDHGAVDEIFMVSWRTLSRGVARRFNLTTEVLD